MDEKVESIIVGGGQAGLSLSYYLKGAGREHVILEKSAQVGDAWRNRRWDSFTLVTPNWSFRLPGAEYMGSEPGGFMPKEEIVSRFEQYEQKIVFPIRYSTEVTYVQPLENKPGYQVFTGDTIYEAKNVIIATGRYQKVKIPIFAEHIPEEIVQISSDAYKNPQSLPPGAVLVVGSGQSGCQIAEELHEFGRKVYLSTGSTGRVPRRYRGKDSFDWFNRSGYYDRTLDMLPDVQARSVPIPHLSGKDGGHEINLHKFCRDGIILLGHTVGYQTGKLNFAPDLKENLARTDKFAVNFFKMTDEYIRKTGIEAPLEEVMFLEDGYHAPEILWLDLIAERVSSIIWAGGYSFDYSMIRYPLLDPYGYPIANHGITQYPGLYLLGMPWMNKMKSSFLVGIQESAQYLAEYICSK
jgi:putative flavoprotein involved in K+ transport